MSDVVLVALIAATASLAASCVSLLVGFRTRKDIIKVNGGIDELVRVTQAIAHKKGRRHGIAIERKRQQATS